MNKIVNGFYYILKERKIPSLNRIKKFLGLGRKVIMPPPDFAQIEITTKCNFNCITCSRTSLSRERINKDMDLNQFKRIIDQLPELKTVKLQGLGEPFLNKDIKAMAEYAKSRGISVITISNGSILPETDVLEFFDEITISFDSSKKQTFESIRRGANFDKILDNVRELIRTRKENNLNFKVTFNMVVSHLNYSEMEDVAKLASELGIDALSFVEVENWYIPSQKEFAASSEFIRAAREKHEEIELKVSEIRKKYKNLEIAFSSSAKRKRTCPWSFYNTFITVDGYVTPCCIRMDKDAFYFDNILQNGTSFMEVWNGEKMKQFREANIKDLPNPVCDLCPD